MVSLLPPTLPRAFPNPAGWQLSPALPDGKLLAPGAVLAPGPPPWGSPPHGGPAPMGVPPPRRSRPHGVPPPRRSRPHGGPAPLRGRGWPRGDAVRLWKSSLGPRWSGAPSVGYPSGPHKASLPPSPAHFKEKSPAAPPFHRRCPGCDSAAVGAQRSVLRWLPSPRPGAGPGAHPPRALSGRRLTNLRSLGMVRM